MSAAAALIAVLLSPPARASDPRLAALTAVEPGTFRGLALSAGPGRPVCACATFDRAKAAAGGMIFVVDEARAGDEQAVRLSEAVIARRGGLSSRAAIIARRHRVPAVALAHGTWDSTGPSLVLEEPVWGAPSTSGGISVRAATAVRKRRLGEEDAVCVDAARGEVILLAPEDAQPRVDAAQAARAFEGLGDVAALESWLASESGSGRAAALMAEIASRAIEQDIPPESLSRLERAARAAAGSSGREALAVAESRAWARAASVARADLAACPAAAADASARDVLERLSARARETATRASAAGRVFGLGDGGLGVLARACGEAASRRGRVIRLATASMDEAAAAAGASRPEAAEIPPAAWASFVKENALQGFLSDAVDDASLGLRRKSERIRERLLSARLDENSDAGRAVSGAVPAGYGVVIAEDAAFASSGERDLLAKVKEAWAASWAPGPLGARLRAGQGAAFEGRLRVARAVKADVSGFLFSREPGSGRRVLIEAARGALESLLEGGAAADRYALEKNSGRILEFSSAAPDEGLVLSPERLKKLARLARALDAWQGGGIEAAFSFDGDRLIVHYARPLEPPRPARPLLDPFSPRPSPEALFVKPVR